MRASLRLQRSLPTTARLAFHSKQCGQVGSITSNSQRYFLTLADIDYMDKYKVFTLGENFPLNEVRDLVNNLHNNHQHYIVMVDPGRSSFCKPSESLTNITQLWPLKTMVHTTEV